MMDEPRSAEEICEDLIRNDPSFTDLAISMDDGIDDDDMCEIFNALKQNVTIEKVYIGSGEERGMDELGSF